MPITETFESVEQGNTRLSKCTESVTDSVLQSKVRLTLDFIKKCLDVSVNPVCLCSFGKDSLVMLHLILRIKKIPVIYWREPFFQSKFAHPQEVAQLWDLDIYDYPPQFTDYIQLEDYFDVFNFYNCGGQFINLYTGTRNYKKEDKKFLCAIKDLLLRPKCLNYEFKWDCIFHGHKQVDPIYIGDRIELKRLYAFGNGLMSLSIKDWTNEEIWAYIEQYELPYNKKRYDNKNEEYNNDLFSTCHDCLDYRKGDVVCPKTNRIVKNIGKTKEQNEKFRDDIRLRMYN